MKNLRFVQLLLLSNSSKSANQFKFSKTFNLITAKDNSVDKSTLLKLLFWGLGCEPDLDTAWKNQDCKTIVDFEIGEQKYSIRRYKNEIAIKINQTAYEEFNKITGNFSIKISEILNFKALLPNQSTNLQETPPPAFYFLPFYIDQKRSWSTAWNNFDSLSQYSNWKSTIVKYHVGLLPPEHFEIESVKSQKKHFQKSIVEEVQKFDTALEVVETFIPKKINTVTETNALNKLTAELKEDLINLQSEQENLLNEISIANSERTHLLQQKNITEKILNELDADYKFSVENVEDDNLECPLCGTIHENSIINRASILTDKSQAEAQLIEIDKELNKVTVKLEKIQANLANAREQLEKLNEKYVIEDEEQDTKINFTEIIESIAGKSIKENVTQSKSNKVVEIKQIDEDVKSLTKEQKDLTTKETIEDRNDTFKSLLSKYIKLLDAEAVNLSEINSPLDYNKIVKEGGAAESVRAILAYYITIYTLVKKYGQEVKSPLVIDTPNQQEQSHTNYDKILNLLLTEFKEDQIILSAMDNEHLKPILKVANIINLDTSKLLKKDKFEEIKKMFEEN
jgi:hypothetical protein